MSCQHVLYTQQRSCRHAYPEGEVDGAEGQAAGQADWAPSHKAWGVGLQAPPLLHIPHGLSLGAFLEAQPCMHSHPEQSNSKLAAAVIYEHIFLHSICLDHSTGSKSLYQARAITTT